MFNLSSATDAGLSDETKHVVEASVPMSPSNRISLADDVFAIAARVNISVWTIARSPALTGIRNPNQRRHSHRNILQFSGLSLTKKFLGNHVWHHYRLASRTAHTNNVRVKSPKCKVYCAGIWKATQNTLRAGLFVTLQGSPQSLAIMEGKLEFTIVCLPVFPTRVPDISHYPHQFTPDEQVAQSFIELFLAARPETRE